MFIIRKKQKAKVNLNATNVHFFMLRIKHMGLHMLNTCSSTDLFIPSQMHTFLIHIKSLTFVRIGWAYQFPRPVDKLTPC